MKTPPAPCGRACRPALGLVLACLALVLAAPPRAAAQTTPNPPERMTYQGFLTDGNGVALGNAAPKNYDVVFRIWNSENQSQPANLLWAEQQTVTVDKGYFSVLLGEGAAVGSEPRPALSTLFKGATASDRWVGITVKGIGAGGANVDILPRLRLMSAPYAFLAQQANRLVQDNGADLITSSGAAVTVNGTVSASSFAGNGSGLNSLSAGNITSGTLDDARLSGNVALRNGGNTFNGNQTINNSLGVGTAPSSRLHVADSSFLVGRIESSAVAGTWLALGNSSAGGRYWQLISSGSGNGEGAGKLLIAHGATANSATARMTFQDNGNVGIGTSTPGRTLHVNGSVAVEGSNPIEFGRGFTKEVNAGQIGYGTHSGGAGGSLDIVGAGTTASNRRIQMWAEGGLTLHGHVANGLFVQTGSGRAFEVSGDHIQVLNGADKNKASAMYRSWGALYLWLRGANHHSSGDRFASFDGDSNWDFSSDRRLKKDIEDAEPMLDRVLKVQVRRYRWKDDAPDAKHKLGVVAQELQPLFPDMVGEHEPPGGGEKTLTVGYSDFGMIAVKALQEFKAQHDAEVGQLKSEVAELRGQMAEMQKQMAAMLRANAELRDRLEQETLTASARR